MLEGGNPTANKNSGMTSSSSSQPLLYELCPVVPGQDIVVTPGGKKGRGTEYLIQVVECFYRIDCVGYSIFRRGQGPLLPMYADLAGPEIGALRKQGVVVHQHRSKTGVSGGYHAPSV
jgi:hypothetical protein